MENKREEIFVLALQELKQVLFYDNCIPDCMGVYRPKSPTNGSILITNVMYRDMTMIYFLFLKGNYLSKTSKTRQIQIFKTTLAIAIKMWL